MVLNYSLDELMAKWTVLRDEIASSPQRSVLSHKLGHELRSPATRLELATLIPYESSCALRQDMIDVIDSFVATSHEYLQAHNLLTSYIFQEPLVDLPVPEKTPEKGAIAYVESMQDLVSYVPFFEELKLFSDGEVKDYTKVILSELSRMVYTSNKLFAPLQKNYAFHYDLDDLIADRQVSLCNEVYFKKDVDQVSFAEDITSDIVMPIVNNAYDHGLRNYNPVGNHPFGTQKTIAFEGKQENDVYHLRIENNGAPVQTSSGNINDIFNLGESSRTIKDERSGSGMFYVKQLVTAYGGDVAVANHSSGEGVVFSLQLPIPLRKKTV